MNRQFEWPHFTDLDDLETDDVYAAWMRLRHGWCSRSGTSVLGMPRFPDVRLTFQDKDVPTFELQATVDAADGSAMLYMGEGTTFAASLGDLLQSVQDEAPRRTVWLGKLKLFHLSPAEIFSMLESMPVFEKKGRNCLRMEIKERGSGRNRVSLKAGPWREPFATDRFLHVETASPASAMFALMERILRVYGRQKVLIPAEQLRKCWKQVRDILDWVDFSVCEEGVRAVVKKLPNRLVQEHPLAAALQTLNPIVRSSYEEVLVVLAERMLMEVQNDELP